MIILYNKVYNKHCVKSVRIWSFSGPYFLVFRLNTERYGVFVRIQFECGKIWTRKTPKTDTFHAVKPTQHSQDPDVWLWFGVQQDFQMFYRILNTSLYGVHRIKEAATLKFRKIDRKAPVSESLFQQSCRREACNSIKKGDCDTDFFLWISKKFKTLFFMEHLRVIFSGISRKICLTLAM